MNRIIEYKIILFLLGHNFLGGGLKLPSSEYVFASIVIWVIKAKPTNMNGKYQKDGNFLVTSRKHDSDQNLLSFHLSVYSE